MTLQWKVLLSSDKRPVTIASGVAAKLRMAELQQTVRGNNYDRQTKIRRTPSRYHRATAWSTDRCRARSTCGPSLGPARRTALSFASDLLHSPRPNPAQANERGEGADAMAPPVVAATVLSVLLGVGSAGPVRTLQSQFSGGDQRVPDSGGRRLVSLDATTTWYRSPIPRTGTRSPSFSDPLS